MVWMIFLKLFIDCLFLSLTGGLEKFLGLSEIMRQIIASMMARVTCLVEFGRTSATK